MADADHAGDMCVRIGTAAARKSTDCWRCEESQQVVAVDTDTQAGVGRQIRPPTATVAVGMYLGLSL